METCPVTHPNISLTNHVLCCLTNKVFEQMMSRYLVKSSLKHLTLTEALTEREAGQKSNQTLRNKSEF